MSNRWPGKALEVSCWVVGTVLIALFLGARLVGKIEEDRAVAAFGEASTAASPSYPKFVTPPSFDWSNFPPPAYLEFGKVPVSSGWEDSSGNSDVSATVSESLPIAMLRIDNVGLEVPVFSDTTERNLNRGAGWVAGTAAPDDGGNFAIAAHRDSYFRVLKDVVVGDVLELDSISQQMSYLVTAIYIVEPEDISPLSATETSMVTLVTCYPFYFIGNAPQRYIVRAVSFNHAGEVNENQINNN